jgi:hypothetical protein
LNNLKEFDLFAQVVNGILCEIRIEKFKDQDFLIGVNIGRRQIVARRKSTNDLLCDLRKHIEFAELIEQHRPSFNRNYLKILFFLHFQVSTV